MHTLWQDLVFGARLLRRKPGFTLVTVLTLGLGIGANTALFSVVNSLLLRPLPYRDADRLAIVWTHSPGSNVAQDWPSPGQFGALKSADTVFEALALARGTNTTIGGPSGSERIGALRTSSAMFSVLGARAALGRVFVPDEDTPGKPPTVILTHGLWQRRFGGDPQVLGQMLTVFGRPHTIVGVMPADFALGFEVMPTPSAVAQPELLLPLPLSVEQSNDHGNENYNVLVRLKPGATLAQAQAQLARAVRQLEREHPGTYPPSRRFSFSIRPLLEQVVGNVRVPLYLLLGAVGCVLLIACANVANLLLARAAAREREMAVRAATGAGRGRVVRQLLTEAVLLAGLGGVFGVFLATWGLAGLRWLNPGNIPRVESISLDLRVLAFTSVVVVLTGLAFGLAPALRLSRLNLSDALKEGARGLVDSSHRRWRSVLVTAEIAVSLVLLVGAGLLLRSFIRVQQVTPGFAPDNVLSMRTMVFGPAYAEEGPRARYWEQLWPRIRRIPGVEAAGGVSALPLSGGIGWGAITIEGYNASAGQSLIQADGRVASTGYFETMKIPLVRGRFFNDRDSRESAPVVIIDENMARTYWRNADPIGRRLKQGDAASTAPWMTIVGVVGSVKHYALDADSRVALYTPHVPSESFFLSIVVRTRVAPSSVAAAVAAEARALEPNVAIDDVKTMEQRLSESLARRRFVLVSLGVFAGAALLLAAIGIYGVMAYTVEQRTREIGIRVALGGQPRDVLALVGRQAIVLAGTGIGLGIVGALGVTRAMTSLLFEIGATDPLTFVAIAVLLLAVALAACMAPARRATTVDPIAALRRE